MNTIRIIEYADSHAEHGVRVDESAALSASPIACEVADWWLQNRDAYAFEQRPLDELEVATRNSPLRKVKP